MSTLQRQRDKPEPGWIREEPDASPDDPKAARLSRRAEAAEAALARSEMRVRELEAVLRPDLLEGAADELEHMLDGHECTQTEAQIDALRNYAALQRAALASKAETAGETR